MEALAVLGSALGIAALEALDSMVMKPQGLGSCLCPPLGATAVLCFAMAKVKALSAEHTCVLRRAGWRWADA
jgi:CBS-domain-containing membrane protein